MLRAKIIFLFPIFDAHVDSSQCHQLNADENCCNKQNTINKDAKETKAKKQNWSIKFNCTKLKGKPYISFSISFCCFFLLVFVFVLDLFAKFSQMNNFRKMFLIYLYRFSQYIIIDNSNINK